MIHRRRGFCQMTQTRLRERCRDVAHVLLERGAGLIGMLPRDLGVAQAFLEFPTRRGFTCQSRLELSLELRRLLHGGGAFLGCALAGG